MPDLSENDSKIIEELFETLRMTAEDNFEDIRAGARYGIGYMYPDGCEVTLSIRGRYFTKAQGE